MVLLQAMMGAPLLILLIYCALSAAFIALFMIFNFLRDKFFPNKLVYIPFYWGFIIALFLILIRIWWIEFFGVWVN